MAETQQSGWVPINKDQQRNRNGDLKLSKKVTQDSYDINTPTRVQHEIVDQRPEVEQVYNDAIKPYLSQTKSTLTRKLDIITKVENPRKLKQIESYTGIGKDYLDNGNSVKFDLQEYFKTQTKATPSKALQQL